MTRTGAAITFAVAVMAFWTGWQGWQEFWVGLHRRKRQPASETLERPIRTARVIRYFMGSIP